MADFRFSARALRSLTAQDDFLRPRNPQAADQVLMEIDHNCGLIAAYPMLGRRIPETDLRYHLTRHYRFRLIYRVTNTGVEIREILHPCQE